MEPLWKLVYLLEPSSATLFFTAIAVSYASASRALNYGKEMERNRDLSEASITLDSSQALMIPIMSSCSLLFMFYLFSSVSQLLTAFTAVASASALYFCLSPYVAQLKSHFSLPDPFVSRCCSKSFTRIQSVLLLVCISLVVAWLVTGHWVLNNLLGISLCIAFVSHVRLPNIKICAMLLACLFVYDVFWVFYSERFFGANVMVSVATQQASNPVHTVANSLSLPGLQLITRKLELPVKIVFPRNMLGGAVPGNNTSDYMMLGLGDMQVSEFDLFTLDDIDSAFQNIIRLTYSQNYHMSGKGEGIVIAPHAASHLLGGTLWKVTKDGEDVIYAVDFNHRRERHLNGTVLESFVRPSVLITDAYNALLSNQPPKRERDQQFLDAILKTLRADGKILVPVDTAGRVLELLLILDQYWENHHLTYPIFFLTYVSSSTIDYAKSFLEWMGDKIAKSFEHTRDNAFLLKHVTLLINKSELEKVPDGPKIVLASMASLEVGFSHDIFVEWAADLKNLVLFTERGQFGTLARMLQSDPPPKAVKVTMSKRIPLVGEELAAYEEEQSQKRKEEALKATLIKEEESKATLGAELYVGDPMVIDANIKQPSPNAAGLLHGAFRDVFIDGFVSPPSSVGPMFPFYENSSEWDDFGEVINLDDYMRKDEDMEQASMQVGGELNGKLDEASASLMLDTTPSKVVSSEQTVYVKCSLVYMDFEGRSDGGSIKKILSHVSPLKLVLVHGSAEATEHLKEHCLKNVCPHVYAPQIEESIDVTSDLCAYKVQLSEKLMSNILFKKLGDFEVAWLDAEVEKAENGSLSLLPLSTPPPPHKTVLVGDIKMADFKQFLASQGIQVEFAGGALRCGEHVTLRKVGDSSQKGGGNIQHIILEGPLSEEYYKIRDHLYSQFYAF